MTWMAWRQFRAQARALGIAVGILLVLLALTGGHVASLATAGESAGSYLAQLKRGYEFQLYLAGLFFLFGLPMIIGVFWGAPVVARELETGTHRMAWNQSITRTRWLAVKLGTAALATVAVVGACSLAVTWWTRPIDTASLDRLQPYVFAARGLVPVAYAVFALAVGVAAGTLLRRTVPAMAVTIVVVVAAQLLVGFVLRPHLVPPVHTTVALDLDDVAEFGIFPDGSVMVTGTFGQPGALVVTNTAIKTDGTRFERPDDVQACARKPDAVRRGPEECVAAVEAMHLRQQVVYQPANRFWPLQFAETGLLLVLTGLLTLLTFWWLRRRLS